MAKVIKSISYEVDPNGPVVGNVPVWDGNKWAAGSLAGIPINTASNGLSYLLSMSTDQAFNRKFVSGGVQFPSDSVGSGNETRGICLQNLSSSIARTILIKITSDNAYDLGWYVDGGSTPWTQIPAQCWQGAMVLNEIYDDITYLVSITNMGGSAEDLVINYILLHDAL